ncbi:MAG TPA: pyridoxamine 5'-phosphate oxidase family protein [Chloroflexota bacterium]|nr:pyridoxamine 5'-phosphate oxidase family protein [Chloroflexota bacterium]
MPRAMSEAEREAFLADTHIGVVSVAAGAGRAPLTTPVWYAYEPGGTITFFTGTGGRRARKSPLIEREGVVTFLVQQETLPYKYVAVEGTVVGTERPPAAALLLAVVRRYLPEEMAQGFVRQELERPTGLSGLVAYRVRPDRWRTADFSPEAG